MTTYEKMETLVMVMGCIIDEWKVGGDPCSLEEFSQMYNDATDILMNLEKFRDL